MNGPMLSRLLRSTRATSSTSSAWMSGDESGMRWGGADFIEMLHNGHCWSGRTQCRGLWRFRQRRRILPVWKGACADEEACIPRFEPADTVNTGNTGGSTYTAPTGIAV